MDKAHERNYALGAGERPVTRSSVAAECLRDNGCSVDTGSGQLTSTTPYEINSASCPNRDESEVGPVGRGQVGSVDDAGEAGGQEDVGWRQGGGGNGGSEVGSEMSDDDVEAEGGIDDDGAELAEGDQPSGVEPLKQSSPMEKKKKEKISLEEEKWIYECAYSVGRPSWRCGYQEKVYEMFKHREEYASREKDSVMQVIARGCKNLSEMDKQEIAHRVNKAQMEMFGVGQIGMDSGDATFPEFIGVNLGWESGEDDEYEVCAWDGPAADVDETGIDFVVGDADACRGEKTKRSTSKSLPLPQPQNQTKYQSKGCGMAQSIPRSSNPSDVDVGEGLVYVEDGQRVYVPPSDVVGGVVPRFNPKLPVERLDTWREGDGTIRTLTDEEKTVVGMLRKVRDDGEWKEVPNLRAVDRKKLMKEVDLVDGVMHNLLWQGMGVTEVNRLLYAGGAVVALRLGMKLGKGKKGKAKKPMWQRRIEASIVRWRGHLSQIEEIRKGKKVREKVRDELERKYQLTERGAMTVSTFLKNKIQAGSTKIRWAEDKNGARRQNNLFRNNQRQLFKELGGNAASNTDEIPDAAESKVFWEGLWSDGVEHNRDACWLGDIREQMKDVKAMEDVVVDLEIVKRGIRRMTNWKAPGPDQVRGFWFKKLTSLHCVLTDALKECVEQGEVPGWMVKGRTVLIQKDPAKGKAVSNYRPIACLPLMWKLLTGIFAEKIYDHLQTNSLLPDEQKGCRKQSRGTKDQLLIDREVLREARRKGRKLSMAWIDYRKAYDKVPHSWILETLGLIKVAPNIEDLLKRSMGDWRTVLTAGGEELGEVRIRRGIFQGDTLSPLLFVVAMIPLTLLLRKEASGVGGTGYRFGAEGKRINHLLFMDDLKLYGRDIGEVKKLIWTVAKFSKDIEMEFGLDKCAVIEVEGGIRRNKVEDIVLPDGKMMKCEDIVLPDGKVMKALDEEGYKYLGVLEGACIMTREMKKMVRTEYLRRVKAVAGSRLYGGYLMKAVNIWAVSVVRYTAGVLEWTQKELEEMDTKTRRILTMNSVFHKDSDVDRLYMRREVGGRGLISVEECVRAEELGLNEYVRANDEWMLKVVAEGTEEGESKVDYKKRMADAREDRLLGKKLHGKFFKEVKDVAGGLSWQWLKRDSLFKWTEAYVCAAQENALKTRKYCASILKEDCKEECRMCGDHPETVGHLVSACSKLAQTEYRRRHDKMGLRVYWEVCGVYGLKRSEQWHLEVPDGVRKSDDGMVEIWWDQTVSTPNKYDANRPDMMIVDRKSKEWFMVDFSVPLDTNVAKKEEEKISKYKDLAAEVSRMHTVKVEVVPIVVGALGVVSKDLLGWLKKLGVGDVVGGLQTAAVIGTGAILRKVLGKKAVS